MDKNLKTLLEKAEMLEDRLSKIKGDVTSPHSTNLDEQAQERENDEVLDGIGNTTREELSLINKAIWRMQTGEYGMCKRCHQHIGRHRLKAVPEAEFCAKCAT